MNERFTHVVARIISADGSTAEAPFIVEQAAANWATGPTVSTLADGRVAITYSVQAGPFDRPDLLTQIIDPRLAAVDLHGKNGDEHMLGTRFNDSIAGGLGADRLNGGAGNDRLLGEAGNDVLTGGLGNDLIYGGYGYDRLSGGVGRDTLVGGANNDVLTGGADRDNFVFQAGSGADRITDFDPSQNILNFRGLHFANADEALAAFSQTADGALFSYQGVTVLLSGIDVTQLDASLLFI